MNDRLIVLFDAPSGYGLSKGEPQKKQKEKEPDAEKRKLHLK